MSAQLSRGGAGEAEIRKHTWTRRKARLTKPTGHPASVKKTTVCTGIH